MEDKLLLELNKMVKLQNYKICEQHGLFTIGYRYYFFKGTFP